MGWGKGGNISLYPHVKSAKCGKTDRLSLLYCWNLTFSSSNKVWKNCIMLLIEVEVNWAYLVLKIFIIKVLVPFIYFQGHFFHFVNFINYFMPSHLQKSMIFLTFLRLHRIFTWNLGGAGLHEFMPKQSKVQILHILKPS